MRKVVFVLFSLVSSAVFGIEDSLIQVKTKNDSLIEIAYAQKGVTYKWGGESPAGYDCSGFVKYCYKQIDFYLPHSSKGMGGLGKKIEMEEAIPGDIILFSGTDKNKSRIGHVGVVSKVENNELFFLHSSSSKKHYGVTETNYHKSGYPKRYIKIIRVIE